MRKLMITTILFGLVIAAPACTDEQVDPLPEVKQVDTITIKFDHPTLNQVEFRATLEDWKAIRTTLLPAKYDPNPAAWEQFGTVNIFKKNGEKFQVNLYTPGEDPGAFSIVGKSKERIYFRGGNTANMKNAVKVAFDKAQKNGK